MSNQQKFMCPCCGFLTLAETHTWEICPVCFWEDDASSPSEVSGANRISLLEARYNFARLGAVEERLVQYTRPPLSEEFPPSSDIPS